MDKFKVFDDGIYKQFNNSNDLYELVISKQTFIEAYERYIVQEGLIKKYAELMAMNMKKADRRKDD